MKTRLKGKVKVSVKSNENKGTVRNANSANGCNSSSSPCCGGKVMFNPKSTGNISN